MFDQLGFAKFRGDEESEENRESIAIEHVESTVLVQKEIDQSVSVAVDRTVFRIIDQWKTLRGFLIQFHVICSTLDASKEKHVSLSIETYLLIQMTSCAIIEDLNGKEIGQSLTQMCQFRCPHTIRCVNGERSTLLGTRCDLSQTLGMNDATIDVTYVQQGLEGCAQFFEVAGFCRCAIDSTVVVGTNDVMELRGGEEFYREGRGLIGTDRRAYCSSSPSRGRSLQRVVKSRRGVDYWLCKTLSSSRTFLPDKPRVIGHRHRCWIIQLHIQLDHQGSQITPQGFDIIAIERRIPFSHLSFSNTYSNAERLFA